jgi:hypothetical protein
MAGSGRRKGVLIAENLLAGCEGFAVHTALARVGTVEDVRLEPDGRPSAIGVRTGLRGGWRLLVSVDQVAEISLEERRILLRPGGLLAR